MKGKNQMPLNPNNIGASLTGEHRTDLKEIRDDAIIEACSLYRSGFSIVDNESNRQALLELLEIAERANRLATLLESVVESR
jgi:hypothetical protein